MLVRMDADMHFLQSMKSLGYSNFDHIPEGHLLTLALQFAIWAPVDTYHNSPWLAPFAIRRARVRTEPHAPGPKRDLWGLPTSDGYFTDDNSLIKSFALKKELLPITNPYGISKITKGLVCCHIWAGTTLSPLLFSFVPNLVWLPKSLAALTDAHRDRTPHIIHFAFQQVSRARYGVAHKNCRVSQAWALLEQTDSIPLNPYVCTELADDGRIAVLANRRTQRMIQFLEATLDANVQPPHRFSKRYHAGAGPRIDISAWPIQASLSFEARRSLITEMRDCL